MIRIERLNRRQLEQFVASPEYRLLPNLPISRHRALSQAANPRLRPDDTLLLLAWLDHELVGYLGVLPDHYFATSNEPVPCGWLSCLWVSDRHRGQSIGQKLVTEGANSMGAQIILTEFTPVAGRLYRKLGLFSQLPARRGLRLYYRLDLSYLLPPKGRFFERMKPFWQVTDRVGNLFVDIVAWFRKPAFRELQWVYCPYVDKELTKFLEGKQENELFRRGASELNWILQHPWILSGVHDELADRYYFSSWEHTFQFAAIKVYDAKNKLQAFLILSRRNKHLKMPCCYLAPGSESLVAEVINWHIYHWNINMFSTFHREMTQYYRTKRTFALYKKSIQRLFMATKAMTDGIGEKQFELQDGDGDCFFT